MLLTQLGKPCPRLITLSGGREAARAPNSIHTVGVLLGLLSFVAMVRG